jgi:hypothetical protein
MKKISVMAIAIVACLIFLGACHSSEKCPAYSSTKIEHQVHKS